jgi:hypothetical protein
LMDVPLLDFKFGSASWADVDNDGDLDLLVTGQRDQAPLQGYSTLLYRNDQPLPDAPPAAPAGLKAFFTTNAVILTWQTATDANQTGGLTYNVRVGSAPGRSDVLSPMSAPNGYRLVPKPGNAGWLTRKVMNGLTRGQTYYWSVQAVDNSYAGSPFASETSVAIGDPPLLGELVDRTMDEDSSLSIALDISDPDGDAAAASITATSSDPALVPGEGFTVTGAGASRTLEIRPASDRNGTATITVSVVDAQGGLASRSFGLTVLAVNDPPHVSNQTYAVLEDTSFAFSIEATDPDGDSLSYELVRDPSRGVLSGAAPQLTYRPQTNFFGDDYCEIRISDSHGASATQRVTFHVTPIPDASAARLSVRVLSDGTPFFTLQAEPYGFYVIETSEDLHTWSPVGTLVSADGLIEFIGIGPGESGARFYRARLP